MSSGTPDMDLQLAYTGLPFTLKTTTIPGANHGTQIEPIESHCGLQVSLVEVAHSHTNQHRTMFCRLLTRSTMGILAHRQARECKSCHTLRTISGFVKGKIEIAVASARHLSRLNVGRPGQQKVNKSAPFPEGGLPLVQGLKSPPGGLLARNAQNHDGHRRGFAQRSQKPIRQGALPPRSIGIGSRSCF